MSETIQPQLLEGVVVHGKQLGRRLGYPTANICVDDSQRQHVPLPGVYAAWAFLPDGHRYRAMVNIGYRPTVDVASRNLSIEAHLSDFSGNLYGQILQLSIVARIRNERQMPSLDALKLQLSNDLRMTIQLLNG